MIAKVHKPKTQKSQLRLTIRHICLVLVAIIMKSQLGRKNLVNNQQFRSHLCGLLIYKVYIRL